MMLQSLQTEFFKIKHQKITWIAPLIVLILMVITGVLMGHSEDRLLIMASYNASEWILLALILVGSTIFSMEFQNNTILTTLYKAPSRIQVYLSKLIVILIYNLLLHGLSLIFTVILQVTPVSAHISWLIINQYQQSLVVNMFSTTAISFVSSSLIISLIFLTSCLVNNNSVVITLNLAIVFLGQGISARLLDSNLKFLNVFKWNPLNMYNLTTQYYNYPVYHDISRLTNQELLMGTLIYTIVFISLGYLVFRKKHF